MNKEYLENIVKKVLLEMENEKPDKNKALKNKLTFKLNYVRDYKYCGRA